MDTINVGIYCPSMMTRRWDVPGRVTGPAEERAAVRSLFLLLAALHGDGVLPGNGTYREPTTTERMDPAGFGACSLESDVEQPHIPTQNRR